jgi:hypothetical protein
MLKRNEVNEDRRHRYTLEEVTDFAARKILPDSARDLAAVLREWILHSLNQDLDHAESLRDLDDANRRLREMEAVPLVTGGFRTVGTITELNPLPLSVDDREIVVDLRFILPKMEDLAAVLAAFHHGALNVGFIVIEDEEVPDG